MKEVIVYCVEYRRDDESRYCPSFQGFTDKDLAMSIAEKASAILHARVVEQRRKVIKTYTLGEKARDA